MAPVGGDLRAECLDFRERFALCVALFGLNGLNVIAALLLIGGDKNEPFEIAQSIGRQLRDS